MLMLPNIIWSKNKPKGYDKYVKNENKVLLLLEWLGEMLVTCLSLIFSDFNINKISNWSSILLIAFIIMILYEIYWIRYFKSNKTMKDILTSEDILTFQKAYDGREANIAIQNAVVKNGPASCAVDHMRTRPLVENYSVDLDAGKVCNQKQSGRCWMFAAYNVFRLEVMRKLNLKNMELSQAYPLFFDKLEKCNFFLENILATLNEKTSSRLLSHLLKDPIGDGGQWNMFVGLTKKYGVCPKEMMPESFSSSRTRDMDGLITLKLRKDAAILIVTAGDMKIDNSKFTKEVSVETVSDVLNKKDSGAVYFANARKLVEVLNPSNNNEIARIERLVDDLNKIKDMIKQTRDYNITSVNDYFRQLDKDKEQVKINVTVED